MKETYSGKRLISLVLSLVMVLSLFSVSASAAETLPELSQAPVTIAQSGLSYDDFNYKVNSDGVSVTITGCSKTDSEITVPSEIDGKAVTVIGKEAFFHCGYTKITLPEGIVTIEACAFEHSTKLESVNIPSTVTTIENAAFDGISKLTVINVPGGVTSIGDWAFHRCSKLTAINVDPSNTNYKSIDGVLFNSDGTDLLSYPCGRAEDGAYNIPDGTETIHTYAFHCAKISSLIFPSTLTAIGDAAVSFASKLESVTIPGNVKTIESDAFTSCQSLTSITVENGVETIGEEAFSYCGKLQSVSIPQSVTSLGKEVLCFCSSLETITVDPGCLCCTVKDGVLFDKDMTRLLCYPAVKADTSYTIPDGVSVIALCAVSNCKNLRSVTLPYGVAEIGASAFSGCSLLKDISIPDSVTVIGFGAFRYCICLTDIVIPDSVTQLGGSAFDECKALKSIKLSNNISAIYGSTFNECWELESIVIPESVQTIEDRVFCYCNKLKSVTLPSHLNYINSYSFLCCSSLESIIIPEGVKGISYRTFYECYNLKNVELPSTVKVIAEEAFINCTSLESITVPVGTKTISSNAFSGCKKLDKIVIPKTVTYISGDAFNNSPNVSFYCCMNSYADRYAESHGIPRVYITDLNLNKTQLDLEKGRQFTLTAEITPDSSKDQKVMWSTDAPDIASVENGLVRAKSKGKAVITAKTEDGTFEECLVSVYVDVIHHEAVPATCTENGTIEYWISDNKYYKDETMTEQTFDITDYAIGHNWSDPEYTWDDEFNCTAKRTCKNDPSHVEIETVKADDSVLTYPECENSGTILYTARFENISFVEQKKEETIPAIGHNWSEPQYSWQGDDIPTECEAWCVCENDYEYQTETADVDYRVVYEPTCEDEGIGEYYAVFKNPTFSEQVWTEVISPTGHKWSEPSYTWSDDNKTCTATRICANDKTHIETETVNTTSEVTKKPTCEEKGDMTYTAVFTNAAFEKQTKTEPIVQIGHKWSIPVWTWNGSNSATATFTCENDPTHVESVTTTDIMTETADVPHCENDFPVYYEASVKFNGEYYSDEHKVILPATGHSYGKPKWTWNGHDSAQAVFMCENCYQTLTLDAQITSIVMTEPTASSEGIRTYTARVTYGDTEYTDEMTETIPKLEPVQTPDEPTPKPAPDEPIGLLGDVNDDGEVNSADALAILRSSVRLEVFDDTKKLLGDVNGDDSVDSADALDVLRHSVGLPANRNIGKPVMKEAV